MFEGNLVKYWLSVSDRREEITNLQASFLRNLLKRGLVLDHCCGPGRLSIPLSAYMPVVGLDLSIYLLRTAKRRTKKVGAKGLNLIRGDMRFLPFRPNVFDNVINFWTSFGYFSEAENEGVLKEIARVLKSKGVFIMDTVNPGWLLRNFRERDWTEDEDYLSLEQRSLDWENKRLRCKWIIVNKRTRELNEINFDHRLYDVQELKKLLECEGLITMRVYGSFKKKEDFDEAKSSRIIILSRKGD